MIRRATPDDAQAIADIWNPFIRDTTVTFTPDEKSPAGVAALIAGPDPVWVGLEAGGGVLGFARHFQLRGGAGYRHSREHTILLAPQARGRGMGRALMQAVADDARAAGHRSLWAGVSAENAAGLGFHAAVGFVTIATLPEVGFKFGRWIDLVLMRRLL